MNNFNHLIDWRNSSDMKDCKKKKFTYKVDFITVNRTKKFKVLTNYSLNKIRTNYLFEVN